jgi:hypothetical protein
MGAFQEEPLELGRGAHQRALGPPSGFFPAVPAWMVPALPPRSALA